MRAPTTPRARAMWAACRLRGSLKRPQELGPQGGGALLWRRHGGRRGRRRALWGRRSGRWPPEAGGAEAREAGDARKTREAREAAVASEAAGAKTGTTSGDGRPGNPAPQLDIGPLTLGFGRDSGAEY